jgi:hypothetical protein
LVKPTPSRNPYAPPQSFGEAPGGRCSRAGDKLVVPAGAGLPERCIKCNEPAIMERPRTFTWHSPGWYLLILLTPLLYIIVGLIVRKKVTLAPGLCPAHRRRRSLLNWTGFGMFMLGIACFYAAVQIEHEPLGWAGALVLIAAVVTAVFAGRSLTPVRIDEGEARFRGAGEAFLDSLPG